MLSAYGVGNKSEDVNYMHSVVRCKKTNSFNVVPQWVNSSKKIMDKSKASPQYANIGNY